MPTKTKTSSASSTKKTVKKAVASTKKVVAKKKPAGKKSTTKKPVAKKSPAKKTSAPKMSVHVEEEVMPVVTVVEKEVHTSHGPIEVHRKYVFIGTCRNCDHMPMSANKLVAVLSIAIMILSGLLISTALPMHFEMPSISMNSLTSWVTPASHVKNL